MTAKPKNHNSILFLTTLSVYLGLVLVGATPPQVLAQAALTRPFDAATEIEAGDDLDKKPDDEKALDIYAATLGDLYSLAREFSARHAEKLRDGRYEFDCSFDIYLNGRTTHCKGGSGLFNGGFTRSFEKIGRAFPHTTEKDKQQVRFNLVLTETDFFLKTVLAQDFEWQAERHSAFYDAGLSKIKSGGRNDDSPSAVIYQNTSVSFENDQVFIVTRLPRAALDSLFAADHGRNAN